MNKFDYWKKHFDKYFRDKDIKPNQKDKHT